ASPDRSSARASSCRAVRPQARARRLSWSCRRRRSRRTRRSGGRVKRREAPARASRIAYKEVAVKRELIVSVTGLDRNIVIEGPLPSGAFRVAIDGDVREVDARAIRPGTWSLVIDGRSFIVDLDRRHGGIAASVGASEAMLQVEDALHRKLAQAAHARG